MLRFKYSLCTLALLPVLVACTDPFASELLLFEVAEIDGFVGDSLQLSVLVTNSSGNPVSGVEVQWTTYHAIPAYPSGHSEFWKHSLAPGVTLSDGTGRARAVMVPLTKGVHHVIASTADVKAKAVITAEFSSTAPTRLTWKPILQVPGGIWSAAGVSAGDRIYLIGGAGNPGCACPFPPRTARFDPAAEVWIAAGPNVPAGPTDDPGVAASLSGDVHFIHGTRHFLYKPASNTWSESGPVPASAKDGVIEAVGGKLYLVSATGAVNAYDPVNNNWSTLKRIPTPRARAASAVLEDRIYVAGGTSGTSLTAFERYDPATDTWSTLAPMPFPRDRFAAATIGGSVCVFGGGLQKHRAGWGFMETYCYDPPSNTWRLEPPMPFDKVVGVSAVEYGDAVYAFGGATYFVLWTATAQVAKLTLR